MQKILTHFVQVMTLITLNTVERELIILKNWFIVNSVSLNENKRKIMVFGSLSANCDIKSLNGVEIERLYETTFLGVIIDHKILKEHRIY